MAIGADVSSQWISLPDEGALLMRHSNEFAVQGKSLLQ
jgi:hypothetical protein